MNADIRNWKPGRKNTAGFSLVELLVAFFAAAIIALTAGALLHMSFASWTRGHSAVDLQRDLTAVTQLLNGMLREASTTDVTVSATEIEVDDGALTKKLTYNSGAGSLVYDPDTGTGGDEITIVSANVQTFTPTALGTGVRVQLAMQNANETTAINAVVTFRN
ncbi:MAG: prepilin-type N-terminal cleavage/methylation domain-containing protein [Verrucomicrobia bacterium]|nr:prepilin-type N-terminal cleavage/methylation domain-containing protein [Verrucomicrobiota bacterium]MDA1086607.1 prepilin-type N-terminal cleavage/methylation domain-containing protein [Verrucomicrobiota bacterium]